MIVAQCAAPSHPFFHSLVNELLLVGLLCDGLLKETDWSLSLLMGQEATLSINSDLGYNILLRGIQRASIGSS